MHKGLISKSAETSAKSTYLAEHPRNISTHIRKNLYKAEQLVSELEKEVSIGQKPKVKIYTGQGGVEQIYEDMVGAQNTTIKAFVDTASLLDRTGTYFLKDWIQMRKDRNVSIKSLTTESKMFPYLTNKSELRESKYLPPQIKMNGSISVYNGKVIYLSNQADDFGIVIDNSAFSNTIESIFDYLWNHKLS